MQQNIIGETFNKLTVISVYGKSKTGKTLYLCKCNCGNETLAERYQLVKGLKKSCGCLIGKCRIKHGESSTRLYKLWKAIKKRCYNENYPQYKNYGGRGIKVCDEWKENYLSFKEFMLSIGYNDKAPQRDQTVERIDVNGNYEPCNCKIISQAQQNLNKRNNHFVTYKGVTKTITEFANDYKLDVDTILNRINNYNYTIEEALEKPIRHTYHKNAPLYEINGEKLTKREWAFRYGLTYSQIKTKTRKKSLKQVIDELEKDKS